MNTDVETAVTTARRAIRVMALGDHDTTHPGAALREARWLAALHLAYELETAVARATADD